MADDTTPATPQVPPQPSTPAEGATPPSPAVGGPASGIRPVVRSPGASAGPATIRLKPVVPPAGLPPRLGDDGTPTVRVKPIVPGQPAPLATPPQPGGAPLPPGAQPLKPAQEQAAKSRTSRISLDAALVSSQSEESGPKTIRLKRPTDAPVGKITSRLGAATTEAGQKNQQRLATSLVPSVPTEPAPPQVNRFTTSVTIPDDADGLAKTGGLDADSPEAAKTAQLSGEAPLTRRKTIRVKRPTRMVTRPGVAVRTPGTADSPAAAEQGDGEAAAETAAAPAMPELPPARTNPFFPILAIVTIFILIALVVVLFAPDAKLGEGSEWPPNTPTLKLPGMVQIPGRG